MGELRVDFGGLESAGIALVARGGDEVVDNIIGVNHALAATLDSDGVPVVAWSTQFGAERHLRACKLDGLTTPITLDVITTPDSEARLAMARDPVSGVFHLAAVVAPIPCAVRYLRGRFFVALDRVGP